MNKSGFDGLFELAIVWLMASGNFMSKLIDGGKKFFNSCFCSISTNKVSNPNYKRNEKQWNLFSPVVFFHRNYCVDYCS